MTVTPAQLEQLEKSLARAVSGEVYFGAYERALYSSDASMYQIQPVGVVVPRTREALITVARICLAERVPMTLRGGGTSQAGQAIGAGVVIDTSKFLNRVIDVDVARRRARVGSTSNRSDRGGSQSRATASARLICRARMR